MISFIFSPFPYPIYAINIRSWIIQTHICLKNYNIPQEYIWETFVMTHHPDVRSSVAAANLVGLAKMLGEIQVQCALILAHKGNLFHAILFAEIAKEMDSCFEKPIILISRIQEVIKSRVIDGHFPGMDGMESGEVNVETMECAICSNPLPFGDKQTPVKTWSLAFHKSCLQYCLFNQCRPDVGGDQVGGLHGMIHGFAREVIEGFRDEIEKEAQELKNFNVC